MHRSQHEPRTERHVKKAWNFRIQMEFVGRTVPQNAVLCPDPNAHATATRRVTSPIHKLPTELLCYIFLLGTHSCESQHALRSSDPRLPDTKYPSSVPVSHVCHRWRAVALQYPKLWTYISFWLSPAWIEACFRRSSSLPLAIYMDVEVWANHRDPSLLWMFEDNMYRVNYLYIFMVTFEKIDQSQDMNLCVDQLCSIIRVIRSRSAPRLEFLHMEMASGQSGVQFTIAADKLYNNTPALKAISFDQSIMISPPRRKAYWNVKLLRMTAPMQLPRLLELISTMPKLRCLETGIIYCDDAMPPTSLALGPIERLSSAWRGTMAKLALFLRLLPNLNTLTIATDGSNANTDDAALVNAPISLPQGLQSFEVAFASITDLDGFFSCMSLPSPARILIYPQFAACRYDDATARRVASLAAKHLWISEPPTPITHLSISQVVQVFSPSVHDAVKPWYDRDVPSDSSFAPFRLACDGPNSSLLAVRLLSAMLPTMQIHTVSISFPAPAAGESRVFSTPENGWTSALCSIPNLRRLKLSFGAVVPILQELLDRARTIATTNRNGASAGQSALKVLLPHLKAFAISQPRDAHDMPEGAGNVFSRLYFLLNIPVAEHYKCRLQKMVLDRCGFFDSEFMVLGNFARVECSWIPPFSVDPRYYKYV
ncbi:hypothetical protein DENSPDRAFT_584670 [Dentipellis sp. KUC8613]|nr:hypothetical protein DENSPDRAFT_584670 [Dentipellis sp. KUC8613]